MRWRVLALLLAGVLGVPAGAAGSGPIDITATTYRAEPVAHTGGTLTIGTWHSPASLNLFYDLTFPTVEAQGIAVWSLWGPAPDRRWSPQLATTVPTLDNGGVIVRADGGMDVRIDLIPGARWSDGQPITCDDVAGMATWLTDPAQSGRLQVSPAGWEEITAVDGGASSECVVHFRMQVGSYLADLSSPLLPSHYTRTVPIADAPTTLYPTTDLASGVYSGPYMPTTWVDGQEIGYVPNPSFWETIRPGTPPFDAVVLRAYPSTTAPGSHDPVIAAYAAGEVDVALDLNHADVPKLGSFPADEIDAGDSPMYEHHAWNLPALERDLGEDGARSVLEAVHYATDKQAIVDQAVAGTVEPICDPVSELDWYDRDTGPCYGYDPSRAAAILDGAGFTIGPDGIREKDGRRLELLACTTDGNAAQVRRDTLALLAGQFEAVGIGLEVSAVPGADSFGGWDDVAADTPCNLAHGTFDVAQLAWGFGIVPTSAYLGYHSSQVPSEGDHLGMNYSGLADPAVDRHLETVIASLDPSVIAEAMGAFQELYVDPADAFPEVPLYFWKDVLLRDPRMHNVIANPASVGTWNIEDWWRDP
jgi:peptide/nickel transport system substrate-binding protein